MAWSSPKFHCKGSRQQRRSVARSLATALAGLGFLATSFVDVAARPTVDQPAAPEIKQRSPLLPKNSGFVFGVLGSFEFKTAQHRFLDDWETVLRRIEGERETYRNCDKATVKCAPRVEKWRALLRDLKDLPKHTQIKRLNRSINRMVAYVDDRKAFGARDHWATPLESLKGVGDCEDYAIIKFVSLLELGFSSDQMRMTVVRDKRRRILHAVLAVQIDDKTYILDNLFNAPVEQRHVLKYAPLFSANLEHRWAHVATNKIRAAFVTATMNGTLKTTMQRATARVASADARDQSAGVDENAAKAVTAESAATLSRAPVEAVVDWT